VPAAAMTASMACAACGEDAPPGFRLLGWKPATVLGADAWRCPDCWVPYPKQHQFLSLGCFEALYGGAAGGGKSDALLMDAVWPVLQDMQLAAAGQKRRRYGSKYMALLLRREMEDLKKSLIPRSRQLYPRLGGKYNENDKKWTFPGGEVVFFGHAQHEHDIEQYQGAAFCYVGFDELTTFTEYQYKYMMSRVRSAHGIPCYLRSATNPGGIGHAWVRRRWVAWLGVSLEERGEDGAGAPTAKPTEVLHFVREGEDDERAIGGEEARELRRARDAAPTQAEREAMPLALGRTFVPATLRDNPSLADDGRYARSLEELDRVTRARLRDGDWDAKESPGELFQRHWFPVVDRDAVPAEVVRVRVWDRAATEPSAQNTDPDWTAGVLIAVDRDGIYYIEDIRRFRRRPHGVMNAVLATAEQDGQGVMIIIIRDPAQAGKAEALSYITALAGYTVFARKEEGDKVTRAKPFSAQAEAGNVKVVRGAWNPAFFAEAEQFPGGKKDQIDASSMGFNEITMAARRARWFRRPVVPAASSTAQPERVASAPVAADDDDE
jgi:predicted phage terminase large subunit-like protein